MLAPHTVCYIGKQVGLHHQPSCTEWTAAHLPYRVSYRRTACCTSRPGTVVTVTHWPAAATGDATLRLKWHHSKLNELLSCSCIWPKSNDILRYSRYIRKNTLQVKSIFTHL